MSDARRRAKAWATQVLAARMVARVATLLEGAARVMPVKGALVARRYYDHPSERALTDCDVVVAGLTAREAARRLVAAGMRVADWSADPNIVDLVDPALPGIHVDVHARPLPAGYGAVTAAWMCEGAAEDVALFGAPVLLPTDARALTHLVGNVLHDHVHRAHAHAFEDIARVLARTTTTRAELADTLRDARLRLGAALVLGEVAARTGSTEAAALRDALALTGAEARYVAWRGRVMAREAVRPTLGARVVARAVSDDPRDVLEGLATAAVGVVRARALNRAR